jgi:hypothetical protein
MQDDGTLRGGYVPVRGSRVATDAAELLETVNGFAERIEELRTLRSSRALTDTEERELDRLDNISGAPRYRRSSLIDH